jgi:hypothetical protein
MTGTVPRKFPCGLRSVEFEALVGDGFSAYLMLGGGL